MGLKFIIIPFLVAVLCQIVKTIIEYIKNKKFDIERFIDGMGGMPSTHSALVSSLTTMVYLHYGIDSVLFAVTLFFSLITIYDAMGIRYESELQAKAINKIANTTLKEKLGHKPIEALVGVIFGIIVTILLNNVL